MIKVFDKPDSDVSKSLSSAGTHLGGSYPQWEPTMADPYEKG